MHTVKNAIIWIVLCSLVMVSCVKENPAYNRENIKGAWIFDTKDGSLIPEKEYMIYEFGESTDLSLHGVQNIGEGDYKWGSEFIRYEAHCCDLKIWGTVEGFNDAPAAITIEQEYEIIEHKDSSLTISPTLYKISDIDVTPEYTLATMRKMPSTYASVDSLKGVWEVNSIGEEALNTFRIEFLEEGELDFYLKQPNGTWTILDAENKDYYNNYDKFVVITLHNNDLLGIKEKWDVSFFNILSLSPFFKKMILSKDSVEYSFTLIESKEEGDETL